MDSNFFSVYCPIPITLYHEFCLAADATVAPKSAQQMTFTNAPTSCKSPWSGPHGLDVMLQTHRACVRAQIISVTAKCNFEILVAQALVTAICAEIESIESFANFAQDNLEPCNTAV